MGLQVEQGRHPHAAGAGETPEVVAQEIDDHQVFGPGLGIGAELTRERGIRRGIGGTGCRALHRLGLESPRPVAQEELG